MTPSKRHRYFIAGLCLMVIVFLLRLLYLQVIQHDFFKAKSNAQLKRIIKLYPNRGRIFDRNMKPLALTEPSYQVYALPAEIENKWVFAKQVAPYLGQTRKDISDKLYATKAAFLWIARHCSEENYHQLKALKLKGIGFIKTEKRVFPNADLGSHLLGFVGIDNQGLGGLEYKYDTYLKGSPGKLILDGDPRGTQLISGQKITIPQNDGGTIVTTLDSTLQFFAELYLSEAVTKHKAESGQVIIMDPSNGDILAMATVPTFNPNAWSKSQSFQRRIRPITDVFEPGSIFKIITLASVLEEDIVSPKTSMHIPETYQLYNKTISEAHDRDPLESDTKTVSEIIEKSLNVGTTLLALKLGEERFYKYMKDFGFGTKTGIELPGESRGLLRPVNTWSGIDIGMISFGQGIAVTGLQMTSAISAIANNGIYVKPRLVHYFTDAKGLTRKSIPIQKKPAIISESTAYQVRKIMEQVVEKGTGQNVKIKGYGIAGKTGTAQKPSASGRGYEAGKYIASFIGFFPVEDPRVVILVAIDSPQKGYYGSVVAGPVFKKCAEAIIDHYHIPPSALQPSIKSQISQHKIGVN